MNEIVVWGDFLVVCRAVLPSIIADDIGIITDNTSLAIYQYRRYRLSLTRSPCPVRGLGSWAVTCRVVPKHDEFMLSCMPRQKDRQKDI